MGFSVFRTRDIAVMTTLYKSLVRSLLEYCCPLWNPSKVTEIQLIEGVQRTFTSRVSGLKNLNYWERLPELKLMSLQRRRERYIILMMWKILHNVVPNSSDIQFKTTPRHGVVAVVPPLSRSSSLHNQSLPRSISLKICRILLYLGEICRGFYQPIGHFWAPQ